MPLFPIDCEQRKTGSKARSIVHYQINSEHWDYREETGNDYGRDCVLELSENNRWTNHKIEGQIKGTRSPTTLKDKMYITFSMETKTINYALGATAAFVLFCVDVINEVVYFLPVQDYFIAHQELFVKLENQQRTINVRMPVTNVLVENDDYLCEIAKCTYVDGPTRTLVRYRPVCTRGAEI